MRCVKLTVLLLVALVILSCVSLYTNNVQPKVVAQTAEPKPAPAPPPEPEPEPETVYFDVPLSKEVQDHIFKECEKANISPTVIVAMIERESNFNQYCIGDDGRSAGLMQIQAKWHIKRMIALDSTDLFDPYQNITVGIDYLAELLNRYGAIDKALTAYNQGSYNGTITNYARNVLKRAGELE